MQAKVHKQEARKAVGLTGTKKRLSGAARIWNRLRKERGYVAVMAIGPADYPYMKFMVTNDPRQQYAQMKGAVWCRLTSFAVFFARSRDEAEAVKREAMLLADRNLNRAGALRDGWSDQFYEVTQPELFASQLLAEAGDNVGVRLWTLEDLEKDLQEMELARVRRVTAQTHNMADQIARATRRHRL